MAQAFGAIADAYDRWYDTPEGQALFHAEVDCLCLLCKELRGRWLEVGVGTGRFAVALGVKEGIDPSPQMADEVQRSGWDVMAYSRLSDGRASASGGGRFS